MGAGHYRILRYHILPNCMAPLIVQLTFIFAYAILSEAVLSFLGLGAQPPTPTWGNIIAEGRQYIREAPWITVIPGPRDRHHRARPQPARRRPARRARPPPQGAAVSLRASASPDVLRSPS